MKPAPQLEVNILRRRASFFFSSPEVSFKGPSSRSERVRPVMVGPASIFSPVKSKTIFFSGTPPAKVPGKKTSFSKSSTPRPAFHGRLSWSMSERILGFVSFPLFPSREIPEFLNGVPSYPPPPFRPTYSGSAILPGKSYQILKAPSVGYLHPKQVIICPIRTCPQEIAGPALHPPTPSTLLPLFTKTATTPVIVLSVPSRKPKSPPTL